MSCSSDSSDESQRIDEKAIKGQVLNEKYLILYRIGKGAFSTVWLCFNIYIKKYYAVKIQNSDDYNEGVSEIEFLKKLKKSECKYINNLVDNFTYNTDDGEHICMVFELLAGSLYDIMKYGKYNKGLPYKTVKTIIYQLLLAMDNITTKFNLLHTDIKPENILVSGLSNKINEIINECDKNKLLKKNKKNFNFKKIVKDLEDDKFNKINEKYQQQDETIEMLPEKYINNISVKLSDFGNCINLEKKTFRIQTRYYRAPEIILEYDFNDKCDIWSVGCMLYELITGEILFDPVKEKRLCTDRAHLHLMISVLGKVPEDLINKSKRKVDFYKTNGLLKGIVEINHDPLYQKLNKVLAERPEINSKELLCVVDLMYSLLEFDPNKRPDIKTILKHEWFDNLKI